MRAIVAEGATAAAAADPGAPTDAPDRPAVDDAVTVCGRSGTVKRSSRGSCERSGGTSSGAERVRAFWYSTVCDTLLPVQVHDDRSATDATAAARVTRERIMRCICEAPARI